MLRNKLVIFDLDDTLIDTSHVYFTARRAFVELLVSQGAPARAVIEKFEGIDALNISALGFAPSRYKKSMLETYEEFVRAGDISLSDDLASRIPICADIITEEMPSLIPGSKALLEWAHANYRLALCTRGIEELQFKKVRHHGLQEHFERIVVTQSKDAALLRGLIEDMSCAPAETWVVGDSIKSDINPGIEAGATCVLFHYEHPSYVWVQEYGAKAAGPFYLAESLDRVRDILDAPEQFIPVESI